MTDQPRRIIDLVPCPHSRENWMRGTSASALDHHERCVLVDGRWERVRVSKQRTPWPPTVLDNEPACGAPEGWRWGYLPCGCRNDGYGNHIDHAGSRLEQADRYARDQPLHDGDAS